jgi:TRAP-type C4-dicarboxylate transport system substrate-binding protein
MKLTRKGAIAALMATTMAIGSFVPAVAQEFKMRLAHHYPDVHIQAAGVRLFVEEVEKNSGGRISVQVFPAQTLITGREALDSVEGGVVEAAPMPGNYQTGSIPELEYFTYPFMFDNAQHFRRAVEGGIYDLLVPKYAERNIVLLNYYHKGALHLMDKTKFLNEPAAFEGERIRSLGAAISALLSSMGANPLSVPLGEVDAAIERNVIDAVTTNCAAHVSRGWAEHLKYVTFMDMSQGGEGLGMNADFFNSLPEDLQQVVRDAAKAMADREWSDVIEADETTCFDKWKEVGSQVHRLTDEEHAAMAKYAKPILAKAIEENPAITAYAEIADKTR